jgi:serine/threonine protein kinase
LVQGFDYASSFTNTKINKNLADLQYISPEVLKEEIGNSKVDIWALGVLAYNIIDDLSPFAEESDLETRKAIINNPVNFNSEAWEHVSDHCKNFIKKCLNKDAAHRPSAEDLLEDPFIKSGAKH